MQAVSASAPVRRSHGPAGDGVRKRTLTLRIGTASVPEACMKYRFFLSFLLLLVSVPASAQTDSTRFDRLWLADYDGPRRLEIGVSAGYAASTDWTDLVALHVFDTRGGIHRQVLL